MHAGEIEPSLQESVFSCGDQKPSSGSGCAWVPSSGSCAPSGPFATYRRLGHYHPSRRSLLPFSSSCHRKFNSAYNFLLIRHLPQLIHRSAPALRSSPERPRRGCDGDRRQQFAAAQGRGSPLEPPTGAEAALWSRAAEHSGRRDSEAVPKK